MAFILSSCASVIGARPAFPTELNTANETISFASIGFGQSGSFTAGPYSGNYKRSLKGKSGGLLITRARETGKTQFVLRGGELMAPLSGACRANLAEVRLAGFSAETEPFTLRCTLGSDDGMLAATLDLEDDPRAKGFRQNRIGLVRINNDVIDIRSLHKKLKGGSADLALGYVFTRGGSPIAAVDVAGKPNIVLAKGLDQPTRQMLISAATGLTLTWTPQVEF
ncbi:MAG: hypothetical protein AABY88_08035 [Pseudomonadota bacterium]